MSSRFKRLKNGLRYQFDFETLEITACGKNGLRIRSTYGHELPPKNWSIVETNDSCDVTIDKTVATIVNGSTKITITDYGYISVFKNDELILRDFNRNFANFDDSHTRSPLRISARKYDLYPSRNFKTTVMFESDPEEKLFGMGQYQHDQVNLKGMSLELAQRNTQASVPVLLSSKKYIFFWNNPSVGRATFSKDKMIWESENTNYIDYWISTGDSYKELIENYCDITGRPSLMPDYALGFWQSKLRYQTQDEILSIAKEYKKRGLPLDIIVEDFFHWKYQGDWSFDKRFFPDPKKLTNDLEELGVKLMVSVWPTMEYLSDNYVSFLEKGYLMDVRKGKRVGLDFLTDTTFVDCTYENARKAFWNIVKKNYFDNGISLFWLDEAEPEASYVDYDNFVYHLGLGTEIGNSYPYWYEKAFYDGIRESGVDNPIFLARCVWAGSQKFNVLLWSGDTNCTFEDMRKQLKAGLNVGLAGIPWWTCDIGGFHGGNINDPHFKELVVRWFEWGAFLPVFRLHGDRKPKLPLIKGAIQDSGSPNEIWSFGEEAYEIMKKYLFIREKMKPYLRTVMKESSKKGYPMIRPMFFEFENDDKCYEFEEQYMLGSDLLVAPIVEEKAKEKLVYLPKGHVWIDVWTKKQYNGGQVVKATIDLDKIPLFAVEESSLKDIF